MDPAARQLAWRKNAQHLYDTLLVYELPWPSESVAWVPEVVAKTSEKGAPAPMKQRLVFTTTTGGQADEYLRVLELSIPQMDPTDVLNKLEGDATSVGGYVPAYACNLKVVQQIFVRGNLQQARMIPQNANLVVTVAESGEAALFDVTKYPTRPLTFYKPSLDLCPPPDSAPPTATPALIALDCCATKEGLVAVGNAKGEVYIYDVSASFDPKTGKMSPQFTLHHEGAVNDVKWHPRRPMVLATCGDDGFIIVHNAVGKSGGELLRMHCGEGRQPTALAWNPANNSLLAVGFNTGAVELYDMRSVGVRLFSFEGHKDYVTRVVWNTWLPGVLASSSVDTTVKVWDGGFLKPEPVFTHAGHTAPVTDVQWNPANQSMLASVDETNGLHIYVPSAQVAGF